MEDRFLDYNVEGTIYKVCTSAQGPKGDTGPTGAAIVSTELYRTDENGNNIYKQTFDNGTVAYFTANRGPAGASAWSDITGKPFSTLGQTLKVNNGLLDVNTTNNAEQDNTLPITSAGVYTQIGNINSLLATI